jgi:DNA polymerase III delta subunit
MLYLLLGPERFLHTDFIESLSDKFSAPVIVIQSEDALSDRAELSSQDLFATQKIFVIAEGLTKRGMLEFIDELKASKNHIVILEDKLDRRKTETATIIKDPQIVVVDCVTPDGAGLVKWLEQRAKKYGTSFEAGAASYLLATLGQQEVKNFRAPAQPQVNLWQLANEVEKLATYVNESKITKEAIGELVKTQDPTEVWDIVNALADKNAQKIFSSLELFFRSLDGTDEKSKAIQCTALLAEQFRSIALVQSMLSGRLSDDIILERTGWKSGRLFMVKKAAVKFTTKIVFEFLTKLEALDLELKTSGMPPRVLLDLIITQAV